ncbi:MAG: MFS transporter, partial [Mycoplasma sp.]|nr:MFS transporter [Mycoplasma sp.]
MWISESDFNFLSSVVGYAVLATQLFGGYLTDKFSSKKLLGFSTIMVGVFSLWWTILTLVPWLKGDNNDILTKKGVDSDEWQAILNNYHNELYSQYLIIYIGWGVCIGLLFWAPLWKLTSQLAEKNEQGAIYGIQGSLVGLCGFVFMGLIGGGVFWIIDSINPKFLFQGFSFLAALLLISSGSLALIYFHNDNKTGAFKGQGIKEIFIDLIKPMKSLRLWLAAFFVLGMYMFQSVFSGYMNSWLAKFDKEFTKYQITFLVVAFASTRSYLLRLFIASPFGRFAQKRKSIVLVLIVCLVIGLIFATLFVSIPSFFAAEDIVKQMTETQQKILYWSMYIIYFIVGIISWMIVTLRFVQIDELPVSKENYGSAVGFISLIAFTPDGWFYTAAGAIGEARHGKGAYSLETYQIILGIAL